MHILSRHPNLKLTCSEHLSPSYREADAHSIVHLLLFSVKNKMTSNSNSSPAELMPYHLLIFTKHPVPGYAKTRLIPSQGAEGAANISRMLTEHTIITARELQHIHPLVCTLIHHANPSSVPSSSTSHWLRPDPTREQLILQQGGTLGDRLISAFERSFSNSATKVIVIGTDSPHITAQILQQAFSALNQHDMVIGPALDGGYYLIGMNRMHPSLFQNIPWSTNTVFADTLAKAFELKLKVEKLKPLRDIDDLDDLLHLPPSEWSDSKADIFGQL